jgi:hypothetical protein
MVRTMAKTTKEEPLLTGFAPVLIDLFYNSIKNKKMKNREDYQAKPFTVGESYYSTHFATLEEAIAHAKEMAKDDRKDVPIHKTIKVVTFPEIDDKDLKIESI